MLARTGAKELDVIACMRKKSNRICLSGRWADAVRYAGIVLVSELQMVKVKVKVKGVYAY